MTTVDVHAHWLPPSAAVAAKTGSDWFGSEMGTDASGNLMGQVGGRRVVFGSAIHTLTLDDRVGFLDEAGLDIQVLSILPPLYAYDRATDIAIPRARQVNDELAAFIDTAPERFRGLATLPLQSVPAALEEFERAVEHDGMVGVAVGTHVDGRGWSDRALWPVLEMAARLGVLVFMHPIHPRGPKDLAEFYLGNIIGNPWETTIAASQLILSGALDAYPELRICLAHGGGYLPLAAGRMDHAYLTRGDGACRQPPSAYLPAFYYDSLTHDDHALRFLVDSVGVSRVVVGTDFPADMGEHRPVRRLREAQSLTDQEADLVLRNASELIERRT